MAIRNSLFGLVLCSALLLESCTFLKTRKDIETTSPPPAPGENAPPPSWPSTSTEGPRTDNTTTAPTPPPSPSPVPPPVPAIPKVAFIFGPGGAKTFAMIGFLQEIQRTRIPVHAVGGTEWGSVIGAFYSLKGSLNDVEWQLSKLKSEEVLRKGLVSGPQMNDASSLKGFLNDTIGKYQVEHAKLPFACPALNLSKNQTFIMNRGNYSQLLPYCLSYPPLFKPFNANLAAVRDVKLIADYLRSQGANYIVLVNVLGAPGVQKNITGQVDSTENLVWNELAGYYSKPMPGVDQVMNLNVDGYTIFDFDRKRDIIQKGSTAANSWVQQFARRFGF